MTADMQVFDAHRILGPLPHAEGVATAAGLIGELDRLGINMAAVVASWDLYGDPRDAGEHERRMAPFDDTGRLTRLAVHIPGHPFSPVPLGAPLVRLAPVLHRFDLFGPAADSSLSSLTEHAIPVSLDATEVGLGAIAQLVRRHPALKILVLNPGYRDLLTVVELLGPTVSIESGTLIASGAIEWLAETAGADRIVFGTGAPLRDAAGARHTLEMLELPDEDRRLVAAGNWKRLVARQ